jgi:hypothetical protein
VPFAQDTLSIQECTRRVFFFANHSLLELRFHEALAPIALRKVQRAPKEVN